MKNTTTTTNKILKSCLVLQNNYCSKKLPKVAAAKTGETCFLPTIEVKDILGCTNSFLRYCRENDLVFWGKIRNTYHYDLFSFRSATEVFGESIRHYLRVEE
jgi:hypothetical protein